MTTDQIRNDQDRTPVTVLGLGPMGQALAGAFLANGHPTTVWNRSTGKADDLVNRGAVSASTAAEAITASPLVVICVLDYDAVESIVEPAAGALAGRTVVNLTTDAPVRVRRLDGWAAEHGVDYLDGSIMTPTETIGGLAATVLYSGPADVYERYRPALAALGGTASHLGVDPGRAAAYDMALLDLFWTSMGGLMHAFALARAEGIAATDLAPYAQVVSRLLPEYVPVFAGQVDAGIHPGDDSNLSSAAAGIDHIVDATVAHGIDAGMLRAVQAATRRAVDAGHGDEGFGRLTDILAATAETGVRTDG